jgi:hypothetical protein
MPRRHTRPGLGTSDSRPLRSWVMPVWAPFFSVAVQIVVASRRVTNPGNLCLFSFPPEPLGMGRDGKGKLRERNRLGVYWRLAGKAKWKCWLIAVES